MLCFAVLGGGSSTAFAVSSKYSNVMTDLQKDESFNPESYPTKENNYSLQVIQIAESVNKELFVYVYAPSAKVTATSINISTAINDSLKYINYGLTLSSSYGTLSKYMVNELTVKADALRYYDISSIFRKWNADYDKGTGNDNTIQEVSFEVGQRWTACTVDGNITYANSSIETILITSKYVDFIRYMNGFFLWSNSCDSHYVAFDTDKSIEKLMEADLQYVTRTWSETKAIAGLIGNKTYGDYITNNITLTYSQKASNNPNNVIQGNKYTWDRIQSVDDFIATESITDDTKSNLQGKKWVLRFYESEYNRGGGVGGSSISSGTEVSEVTILRLKFETDGVVYNLGVVDNKQSGDEKPGNLQSPSFDFWKWLSEKTGLPVWLCQLIVGLIGVSILLSILSIFLPIKEILRTACYAVWRCVWWLVTAPFRLIIWLCKKIFKNKNE